MSSGPRRLILACLCSLLPACTAERYILESHVSYGPHASMDVWRDRQTGKCIRRTEIGDYYSEVEVECWKVTPPEVPERKAEEKK